MRLVAIGLYVLLAACTGTSDEPRLSSHPTLHAAEAALQGGNPSLALKITDVILKDEPRNEDAFTVRGDALFAMGQNTQAATSLQRALQIRPASVRALISMGRVRLVSDPGAAEALFRRVLEYDPNNSVALNNLGIACDMQQRHADAQMEYRHAIALDTSNVGAQVNLGRSLAMSGDKAGALTILQPLAERPEIADKIRSNLATALGAAGDGDAAGKVMGANTEAAPREAAAP